MFYLPDAQFARLPEIRSITGLSRLFFFDPRHQYYRLSRRRLPIMLRLRLAFLGRPDMGGFIAASVTAFLHQQDNRLSMARLLQMDVKYPQSPRTIIPFVRGNWSIAFLTANSPFSQLSSFSETGRCTCPYYIMQTHRFPNRLKTSR